MENVKHGQPVYMCRLILVYTLCELNAWSRTLEYEFMLFTRHQHVRPVCHNSIDDDKLQTHCYGRPLLQVCLLPDLNTIPDNCIRENSL